MGASKSAFPSGRFQVSVSDWAFQIGRFKVGVSKSAPSYDGETLKNSVRGTFADMSRAANLHIFVWFRIFRDLDIQDGPSFAPLQIMKYLMTRTFHQ